MGNLPRNKSTNFSGLILAAGMGTRLGELSRNKGKALFEVAGKPLIKYAIEFMRALGAGRVFVVGGYVFPKLQALLGNENIELRHNPNYEGKGNLFSLRAALPEIDSSFLMMNVDHIYNCALTSVIRSQFAGITAFCDFDRKLGDDDMKVALSGNFQFPISPAKRDSDPRDNFQLRNSKLSKMSKQLTEFHCGYVGMTYVDKQELTKYKKAVEETKVVHGDQAVVENVLAHLAEQGERVGIGDISGYGWLEIDTPDEFYSAEKSILTNPERFLIG